MSSVYLIANVIVVLVVASVIEKGSDKFASTKKICVQLFWVGSFFYSIIVLLAHSEYQLQLNFNAFTDGVPQVYQSKNTRSETTTSALIKRFPRQTHRFGFSRKLQGRYK